jgi:ABC-type spermidine/putrescine transport system permease subunit I
MLINAGLLYFILPIFFILFIYFFCILNPFIKNRQKRQNTRTNKQNKKSKKLINQLKIMHETLKITIYHWVMCLLSPLSVNAGIV